MIREKFVKTLIILFILLPIIVISQSLNISQIPGSLNKESSSIEISLGVYRWVKAEYKRPFANGFNYGVWVDLQPLLIGIINTGLYTEVGKQNDWGGIGLKIGAGYTFGVGGDNIAGHGFGSEADGAQGYLFELENTNGLKLKQNLALITQTGIILTLQRNTNREPVNRYVTLPYWGLGLEKIGKRTNIFFILRISYVNRIDSDKDIVLPDAKIGIKWAI